MGYIYITVNECDGCGKRHDTAIKIIWIDALGVGDAEYRDLCFCNKDCLKKWIDDVIC